MSTQKHSVIIIGGGTAGISVAAKLRRQQANLDIAIIDPAEHHYYKPAWTQVDGGTYNAKDTERRLRPTLPAGVQHIAQEVTALTPEQHQVTLSNGDNIADDYLVVAAGIQSKWGAIKGLHETLGRNG